MSNSTVLAAIITAISGIVLALVGFWVKRIEGKDRIFRKSVTKDMRVMYALKDDYSHLHTWALDVRAVWNERERDYSLLQLWVSRVNAEWDAMQRQLQASGVITEIRDLPEVPNPHIHPLPEIPEPEWRRIEDGDDKDE